ncbi:unnamed protein product [Caenorhabditis sp. 36 PRJEB53466]|nr:unnamed protein product [Caenorhabditis sp. 36 PRJEB53466]
MLADDFTLVPSTSEKCLLPDVEDEGRFDSPKGQRNQRHMSRSQCPSKCQVCRHPATGYHYEVPSCNGCKTFFRRSILDGRKYCCLKMKKCMSGDEPTDLTRRMCRACRFESCVEAGMNPSAIQAEVKSSDGEELKKEIMMKRQTVELNTTQIASSFEEKVNGIIEKLTRIELKIEPLYTGGLPPGFKDTRRLEDVLRAPLILCVDEIPNPSYCPVPVNEITGETRIHSACFVHTCLLANVEYSKMFEFWSKIDFESKLRLMKHATIMCSDIMSAFFNYSQLKSDKLTHPNGQISGPPRYRYGEAGAKHQVGMQKTLVSLLRNQLNRVEYLLLKAIVLCNPAVCGLSIDVQQVIGKEREQYVRSLLAYCLLSHGNLHGPARFSALLAITTVLENQQKAAKDFHQLAKATVLKNSSKDYIRISTLFEQIIES